jgi:Haemolysin-III related
VLLMVALPCAGFEKRPARYSAGLVCVAVSLLEVFQHYKFRPLRAGMYVSLGLWGVVPAIHVWRELGSIPEVMKALKLDILMGILYVVRPSALSEQLQAVRLYMQGSRITSHACDHVLQGGAVLYAFRFPECLKPGRFDYLFNSHQLFHLAVVIAAFVHYRACLVRYGPFSLCKVAVMRRHTCLCTPMYHVMLTGYSSFGCTADHDPLARHCRRLLDFAPWASQWGRQHSGTLTFSHTSPNRASSQAGTSNQEETTVT